MLRDQKAKLRVASARLLVDNLPVAIFGTWAVATAFLFMLFNDFPRHLLFGWYLAACVLTVIRYLHYRQISASPLTESTVNPILNRLTFYSICSGSIWGILGYSVVSLDRPLISVILLMIFTGLIATASATMSHVVKIFVTFVLFSMVPTAYKFYTLGEPQYYWICALIFLYIFTVLLASRGIRKSTSQAIELQFQNLDLVESLTEQNTKTEAALQEAQRASKAKTRFFAAANHDLRQPLHSLGLFTATLASQVESSEQRRIVDHIDNSVKSLEDLFNSILDISALDAGTLKVHKQHFNIKDYFDRIAPDLSELAKEKDLYFDVDVGDHVVYSDPTLLHRVINNLAVNAIAYTEIGGIRIVSESIGPNLQISVIDTGKGIADEQVHAIFDEFVQLDNPERDRTKGLGLGLSIVQRITDLLDIELNLQTKAGEGSAFHIVLEGGNPALANSDSDAISASKHNLDGEFVLVIDDEAEARLAMEGLLLSWSCEVMLASSGAEAVQQLEEYGKKPSLIISDFRLRVNENGGDAIHAIKQHFDIDVPAIIITGDTAPEQLREIDKLQLPTLHKPCKPAELKALLFALTN